jgi:hypothetical protein
MKAILIATTVLIMVLITVFINLIKDYEGEDKRD